MSIFSFLKKSPHPDFVNSFLPTNLGGQGFAASTFGPSTLGNAVTPTVIETLDQVPQYHRLLSEGNSAFAVPAALKSDLIVLETGIKCYLILYNPQAVLKPLMKPTLSSIRAQLAANQYKSKSPDCACTSELIVKILENFKNGSTSERGSEVSVKSEAKTRFLEWETLAVQEKASDLHIQIVGHDRAIVQLRIDGEIAPLPDGRGGIYTQMEAQNCMAWAYADGQRGTNSDSKWLERENQYVMTQARVIGSKQIVLRIQTLKGYAGPKLIARLLNVGIDTPTLTFGQAGYAKSQQDLLWLAGSRPSGLGLLAGITGSGKTTTLKSFVELHPENGKLAIYSLEDPVEYPLKGVHQVTFQLDIGDQDKSEREYQETVTALMRSDPDWAIVGELRSKSSAGAAQQIVETGHMALATTHAHRLTGIFPRLTNPQIGMNRESLTSPDMINFLAYQALVPILCPHCKLPASAAMHDLDLLGLAQDAGRIKQVDHSLTERFKLDSAMFWYRNPKGCSHCRGRGTAGLTVVAEMILPGQTWLDLSRKGLDQAAMMHYRQQSDRQWTSEDMTGKTITEHTLFKATQGLVDPRQCTRFDSLELFELTPDIRHSDTKGY